MIRNIIWLLTGGLFLTKKGEFSCGHVAPLRGEVDTGKHSFSWNMTPAKAANQVCSACAVEKEIKCCFCGCYIYPGQPVALYSKESAGINWNVAVAAGELSVIGCLNTPCCPSGGAFGGYWMADGFQSYSGFEKDAA